MGHWGEILNSTQKHLLNLSRAFVANPEILVVHHPFSMFDEPTSSNTIKCLRCFVREKGLEMDKKTVIFRRPRTCVLSTAHSASMKFADLVLRINHDGVEELKNEERRRSALGQLVQVSL